jgi:ligand-binding SRPBCC domain-containing protein
LRLHGIPIRWQSVISVWEPPFRFVDEQVRGPYRSWLHEHTFEERDGGTLCRDRVEYDVPGGWLVNRYLVARDVKRIFEYRAERFPRVLEEALSKR